MRATYLKPGLPVLAVVAIAACADARANDATQADLKRDLELASATTMKLATPVVDSMLLSAMETKPQRAPQPSTVVRRGAGSRAVQSETPTVEAEPELDVAEVGESEVTETMAVAPAPEPINEPVAVAPRAGDYGTGTGIIGAGRGTVIRGGGVDGDNCELHRRGRGGVYTPRGPIFVPRVVTTTGPATRGSSNPSIGSRSPRSGTRIEPSSRTPSRSTGRAPKAGLR